MNTCESLEANLTVDDMTYFYKQDESFMLNIYDVKKIVSTVYVLNNARYLSSV